MEGSKNCNKKENNKKGKQKGRSTTHSNAKIYDDGGNGVGDDNDDGDSGDDGDDDDDGDDNCSSKLKDIFSYANCSSN